MTRRHESLIPLTHDHHHALAQARRLRISAEGDEQQRLTQAREFVDFFDSHTLTHFREEEEIVFPLVVDEPDAVPLLTRLLMEHVRLHAFALGLRSELRRGAPSGAVMKRLAALLESHIRLEEKALFPLIERMVPGDLLGELTLARAMGPAAGPGPATETISVNDNAGEKKVLAR
jgi:hemerythrin-like domain-containing protein